MSSARSRGRSRSSSAGAGSPSSGRRPAGRARSTCSSSSCRSGCSPSRSRGCRGARLGEGALRSARRDGARVRGDRRRAVPTRNVFWNPKVIVDNAYAPSSWFYRVNSRLLRPVDLRPLPRRRDPRGPRRRALRARPSPWAALVVARHHVGRPRAVVLAVELRRARRRRLSRSDRALAAARGRAARGGGGRARRGHARRAADPSPAARQGATSSHITSGRSKLVSNGLRLGARPSGHRRRRRRLQARLRRS